MVSGRCCISLKTKSWREDSYYVKKKIFIGLISYEWIFSRGCSRSIHPLRLWSRLIRHGPAFAGLLDTDHYQAAESAQGRCDMWHNADLLLRWLD